MVFGHDRPAVGQFTNISLAGVDHGFDREDHAFFELEAGTGFAIVQDLGVFVEMLTDAVTAELADDRVTMFLSVRLDRVADIAERSAGSDNINAFPESFEGDVA